MGRCVVMVRVGTWRERGRRCEASQGVTPRVWALSGSCESVLSEGKAFPGDHASHVSAEWVFSSECRGARGLKPTPSSSNGAES